MNDAAKIPGADAEVVTLGAGCFWCIEAVLQQVNGVQSARSGYMGGQVDNPTYEQICTGTTGHAEVVQVQFDPTVLPFNDLLEVFWQLHDPTTLDRQGNDVGSQYRSAIFFHQPGHAEIAQASKDALDAAGIYASPAVTTITPAGTFFPAESYHQDYYQQNRSAPYCRGIIAPKLQKLGLKV